MQTSRRRRVLVAFLLALTMSLVAAACSSDGDGESGVTGATSPDGSPVAPPVTDVNGSVVPEFNVTIPGRPGEVVPPSFNITIPLSPNGTQPADGVTGEPPTTDPLPTLPATTLLPDPIAPVVPPDAQPLPPPPPPAAGLPDMLMSTGDQLWSWSDGNPVVIVNGQRGLLQAFQIGDAVAAAQDGPLVVRFDGQGIGLDPDLGHYLAGAGRLDGAPTLAVVEVGDFEDVHSLFLIDMNSGVATDAGVGSAPEFIVRRVGFGSDRIVTSAFADLTEVIEYRTADGVPLTDRRSPTEDLVYNSPPKVMQGVLSPDGTRLAYLEAPDFNAAGTESGSWAAVVYDVAADRELQRFPILSDSEQAHWLDYDGRFIIVSAGAADTFFPNGAPVLIDTENETNQRQANMSGYVTFIVP